MQIGSYNLGKKPAIVAAISDQVLNEDIVKEAPDVLELRVDNFVSFDPNFVTEQIQKRKELNLPLILTIRNDPLEGASGLSVSDSERLNLFRENIQYVDAVDIELSSEILSDVVSLAKDAKKRVLVSAHNFQKTPPRDELDDILRRAKDIGAHIVKVAAFANEEEDIECLKQFTIDHKDDNIVTMSLGNLGSRTRFEFVKLGSLLTYSFIGEATAPGQLTIKELKEHLFLDEY